MKRFTTEPLCEVMAYLAAQRDALATSLHAADFTASQREIEIEVLSPELAREAYPGQEVEADGQLCRHRSYRLWMEAALELNLEFLTPRFSVHPFVCLRFRPLCAMPPTLSLASAAADNERYGPESSFYRLQKREEPRFLADYRLALDRVGAAQRKRVLDLGVHRGDELQELANEARKRNNDDPRQEVIGIDYSEQALQAARERYADLNYQFVCADLAKWDQLDLAPFDLIISIGTLQSRSFSGKQIFPLMLRKWLKPGGAVILGLPFVRYQNGEPRLGGKLKNYREPEHSLVFKDAMYYRTRLQSKCKRVTLTGSYYLFLTGW